MKINRFSKYTRCPLKLPHRSARDIAASHRMRLEIEKLKKEGRRLGVACFEA